jgi:hypothetical protein
MKKNSLFSGKDSNMGLHEYRDGDYTDTFHAVWEQGRLYAILSPFISP